MSTNFYKKVEDFNCVTCGQLIKGNGYTNHCPLCLTSLHVDLETPGDRAADCFGKMKAISVTLKGGLPHKLKFICQKCGKIISNIVSKADSIEEISKLPIE